MGDASLGEQLAAAAREMQGETDPQQTMHMAVRLSVEQIDGAQHAGITLIHRGGRLDTPAADSEVVLQIDALQIEMDQGPCLEAIRHHETVSSPDLAADDRWPEWGQRVVDTYGIRSMLCFQLFTHEDNVGALNLYSPELDGFDEEDREHGLALAAHVAVAVAAAQEVSQLRGAMDARTTIGQALGILMERYDLTPEQAFSVLSRVSSLENRKLRMLAAELVRTRNLPGLAQKKVTGRSFGAGPVPGVPLDDVKPPR
jgi:GAF domain-containing protein